MLTQAFGLAEHLRAIAEYDGRLCPNCHVGVMRYTGIESQIMAHFAKWEKYGITFNGDLKNSFSATPCSFLYRCNVCGLGRFYPVVEGSADYYAAITETDYYSDHRPEFDLAYSILAKGQGDLLEIGSGRGHFLHFLQKKGVAYRLHAIDNNPDVQSTLTEIAAVHHDYSTLPEHLDAVCAFQVLEHMGEPFDFVDRCREILRPGGLLLISVPDYDGAIRFYGDSHTETPPHHLTRWNKSSLNALLLHRNFSILCNKGIPLQKKGIKQYANPIFYHFLQKLNLERYRKLVDLQKSFEAILNALPFDHVPFTSFDRFVCARYDG